MSLKRYSLVLAGFLIIALGAIVAPVSANTITIDNSSPTALSYNITHNVNTGDTLILNPGTYFENNIAIPSSITSLTIEANTSASAGGSPANTIIDAQMDGIIFSVSSSTTYLTIDNLTLKDGSASGNGGAIDSLSSGTLAVTSSTFTNCTGTGSSSSLGGAIYVKTGTVTLTSSNFTSCSAFRGGAIYTETGTVTLTSANFTGCKVTSSGGDGGAIAIYGTGTLTTTSSNFTSCGVTSNDNGGAIFSEGTAKVTSTIFKNCQGNNGGALAIYGGTVTLTSSTFTNCQASYGGAIYSSGVTPSITSSTFTGCSAGSGPGAIAISSGSISMNFSRIYQDGTEAVLVSSGSGSADNNWWGQNSGPATGEVSGITVNSWLILGAIASPSTLYTTGTSAIQANLTYNQTSSGSNFNTAGGGVFLADGIPVTFAIKSGSGSILPLAGNTTSGTNTTTFTPTAVGTVMINATVDGQDVSAYISVSEPTPTPTPAPASANSGGQSRTDYWAQSGNSEDYRYTGPAPTPLIANPTPLPSVQQTASAPVTPSATAPPLPTNTPRSGLDAVPVIGALGLCGAIFLFWKNGN